MRIGAVVLLAGLLLAGCENKVDVAKQREALMQADRDSSIDGKDADKLAAMYTADASIYLPGAPPISGAKAIQTIIGGVKSAPGWSITMSPAEAGVSAGGDLGYTVGMFERKSDAGNERARYARVWAKQADGSWKIKEYIASAEPVQTPPTQHAVVDAASLQWSPAPDGLPKGATLAAVAGDPSSVGPYVLRLKVPAGYRIMPHWHPADENVTVLAGTVAVGSGDVFDESAAQKLDAGGVAVLPARMHHFLLAKTAATLQVHGMGPFAINYVNAADDPRQQR